MPIKAKKPDHATIRLSTTTELVKKLSNLNRILAHSEERFKLGDVIIETHRITGELFKRNERLK